MTPKKEEKIIIRALLPQEARPYDLFLLADPSKKLIDQYLSNSKIYIALIGEEVVGQFVLLPLSGHQIEIKNIAIAEKHQGKGIGKLLLNHAIEIAKSEDYDTIRIGTANSSIRQLYLYQSVGFEITEIKKNFFIENYSNHFYENGIQVKHMIVLEFRTSNS